MAHGAAATVPTFQRVTYPVKNVTVNVAAAAAGVGFGTVVIGDLPEGNVLYVGGVAYLQFLTADADIGATWTGAYGVGTTPDADGSLATTEINLIGSSAIAAATAKLSPVTRGVSAADSSEVFDNTDNALEINLNLTVTAADITDASAADFTVNGYVQLVFIVMGDD
jgi:hypothetical protein